MWLFGYGSLMWDGWEARYGCVRRMPADLAGHRRIFNKTSLERWGTHARPGLTLNLTRSGACRGVAFEFDDARVAEITDYLCARETCAATEHPVRLPDASEVPALVYIYDGPRLIDEGLSLEERAEMIVAAAGIAGSSFDYITSVRAHLAELGVTDPAVEELWAAVAALKGPAD
jgi:cation transport protein ChaC